MRITRYLDDRSGEIEVIPPGDRLESAGWLRQHPSVTTEEWFAIKRKKAEWDRDMGELLLRRREWDLPSELPDRPRRHRHRRRRTMPPKKLRQLVRVADRLQAVVAQFQSCLAALVEAEGRPQPPAAPKQRRSRWVGPVSAEVHDERDAAYTRCFTLAMHLGRDATSKFFAARHGLNVSEISRLAEPQRRGIAPGSVVDTGIRRALREDTEKYEAEFAKRLGAVQIPNSSTRFARTISA